MSEEEKKQITTQDLTLFVLTMPLRQALVDKGVDENAIAKVLANILSTEARHADQLRAVELLQKWLGVSAGENINVNLSELDVALAELEAKRKLKKKKD